MKTTQQLVLLGLFLYGIGSDGFEIKPEGTKVSVTMPAEPKASVRQLEPVPGQSIDVQVYVYEPEKDVNFTLTYHDQAEEPADNKAIKAILDGAVKVSIVRTLGSLEKVERDVVRGHEGRKFEFTCVRGDTKDEAVPMRVSARLILVGKRLYTLNYAAPEAKFDRTQADAFLNSFQFSDSK